MIHSFVFCVNKYFFSDLFISCTPAFPQSFAAGPAARLTVPLSCDYLSVFSQPDILSAFAVDLVLNVPVLQFSPPRVYVTAHIM